MFGIIGKVDGYAVQADLLITTEQYNGIFCLTSGDFAIAKLGIASNGILVYMVTGWLSFGKVGL